MPSRIGGSAGGGSGAGHRAKTSLHVPTQQVSDYKYPVFNAGPRVCLGRPLAYLEVQLALLRAAIVYW